MFNPVQHEPRLRESSKRLRQAQRACAYLGVGTLLSVFVTWGWINTLNWAWDWRQNNSFLAQSLRVRDTAFQHSAVLIDGAWWTILRVEATFYETYAWDRCADGKSAPADAERRSAALAKENARSIPAQQLRLSQQPSTPPWWSGQPTVAAGQLAGKGPYESAFGWPVRCFICPNLTSAVAMIWADYSTDPGGGVIQFDGWHFLYHPIPLGLLADSGFYGAVVWLLTRTLGAARRRTRRRRGLCPACGYPRAGLAHPTCPECGHAKA